MSHFGRILRAQPSRVSRVVFVSVCLLLFMFACGREPEIIINIAAWPDGVERLRVRAAIDGAVGTDIFLNRDQTRFAVRLPASSQGSVQLDAIGLDLMGCKLATGNLNEPIPDNLSRFVERTLVLSVLPSHVCVLAHGIPFMVGKQPDSVAVGDFNGDMLSDVVVTNSGDDSVSVLLGDVIRGVSSPSFLKFPMTSGPDAVAVGDFNDDRKLDLAVALSNSNVVSLLLGDGMGGFAPPVPPVLASVPVGKHPGAMAVGDFNGDMKPDLAVVNTSDSSVIVLYGDGKGSFPGSIVLPVGAGPFSVAAGDFNGDMNLDLAVTNVSESTVSVLLGNGVGGFSSDARSSVGMNPRSVAIGDFNGDMKPDLAVASFTSSNVSVLLGNGAGDFGIAIPIAVGANPYAVAVADLNGDKLPDLVTANYVDSTVSVRLGDGMGGFGPASNFSVGLNPVALAVGDFNRDMRPDLAVANITSNDVTILLNQF